MLGRFWLCGQPVATYYLIALLNRFYTLFAAVALFIPTLEACRYSVRDVGFTDLGSERYKLRISLNNSEHDKSANRFNQAAKALLVDSNVELELFKTNLQEQAAVLIAPDGKRKYAITTPDNSSGFDQLEWSTIESVITSPARNKITKKLISNFAVVLLIEGSDKLQTERARLAAIEAIEAITKLMPKMPKPVDNPPVLFQLPLKQSSADSVLLWSLGMEPKTILEPQAVVLMGRGRRVGEMMSGGLITRTALQEALAVIGQDCECGLDRVWMQGDRFPLAWGQTEKKAAFTELGFDPDNPKVKAEISRIIARGPNSRPSGNPQSASENFDQLALGYSEDIIGIDQEIVGSDNLSLNEHEFNQESNSIEKVTENGEGIAIEKKENIQKYFGLSPLFWSVTFVVFVALAGGGLVLLRNRY